MAQPDTGIERAATDRGLTGDKIAVTDPAAAPVNTDAEAAGTPTPRDRITAMVRDLMDRARGPEQFGNWEQPHARANARPVWPMLGLIAVLALLGILLGWWGLR